MTKTTNPAVRILTGISPETSRDTLDTPNGPIYSGTPQAKHWQATKAWADPLIALATGFATQVPEKSQAVADIAAILAKLPDDQAAVAATLHDLSEALQGRLTNHTRTNFTDVGGAHAHHVATLRGQARVAQDALVTLATFAPRPPHPDARQPAAGQPLGTGLYKQING